MADDLDIENLIAECKCTLAECDSLAADAKLLTLQEAREARSNGYLLHTWLVRIVVLLPIKVMLGICNMLLLLPFDDEG
jgi:hypothetical protein